MKFNMINIIMALTATCWLSSSCSSDNTKVTPQGNIVLENRDVATTFSSISVESGIEIILNQDAANPKVQVETYANVQSFVEVVNSSRNSLVVRVRKGTHFKGNPNIRVRITVGDLQLIALSGGSRATIASKLEGNGMMFELSGGSAISGEVVSEGMLTVDLSGGSTVSITGSTDVYNIANSSGGSKINGFDFVCNTVNANLSGGSHLNVTANKEIKVDISGGSRIMYKGPEGIVKLINISGGSDIVRVN